MTLGASAAEGAGGHETFEEAESSSPRVSVEANRAGVGFEEEDILAAVSSDLPLFAFLAIPDMHSYCIWNRE